MITMAPPATTHQPDHKLAEAIPPQSQPHQSHNTNQSHSSGSTSRSLATPLRSLTISKPKAKIESGGSNKFRPTIIVVTKFPFTAESSNELSVNKGEILKLLDEPRDGWLLVKCIERLCPPGLIPATYVDIALNDQVNPITLSWLHGIDKVDIVKEHNYLNLQFNKVEAIFQTINNKAYPVSASISNFLLFKERYWYRLDIQYSDKSRAHLCRYYQDFYNLHITMLDLVNRISSQDLKLPKLPEPLPTTTTLNHYKDDKITVGDANTKSEADLEKETTEVNMLLKRCNDLNVYINKLILNKYFQTSNELITWLELRYKNLPGFVVEPTDEEYETELVNEEISNRILPNSIDVVKVYEEKKMSREQELEAMRNKEEEKEEEAVEVDDSELPARTKSKNIYNNYQQASHIMSMAQVSRQGSVSLSRADSKANQRNGSKTSNSVVNSPNLLRKQSDLADTSTNSVAASFSLIEEGHQQGGHSPDTSRGSHTVKIARNKSLKPKSTTNASVPPLSNGHASSPQNVKQPNGTSLSSHSPQLQQRPPTMSSPVIHPQSQQYSPKLGALPKVKTQSPHQPIHPNNDKPYQLPQSMPTKMSPMGINPQVFPISGYVNATQSNVGGNAINPHTSAISSYSHSSGSPSPTSANTIANLKHQYIKCKIVNPHDEIIAFKLPKSQIKTVGDFKNAIKSKVFYSKLYIKLPNLNNFENIDVVRFNITEFLKFNDRVLLRIA
ncbi:PX domain family protein [Candida parapsilosis]|uniref:SH3 domain-containing protein n=2 Tax=Candida parapsilosis TaxID=5480 RepID=G8BCG8_CANPC|nr:uncharacterized protein CPAR2_803830 [Candida parapsilosis]KAF6051731.1 PX domain family protein [Candida parapsilosis]KAF6052772.1 PX domain family protein [Candida parapsilosis]KAF6053533.1 PX domain family protein [Candida parapsilosis]KAF6064549.1 PX domain family protein [Candida parapsilosis]KAI5904096.1 Bud emergence protein 1 [Candida parapsilosis]